MKSLFRYLSWALITYAVLIAISYILLPSFRDHVSPLVTITSWIALKFGAPIYHPIEYPAVYNLMYGPLLYLAHWPSFLIFGGNFFAAKFMGVSLFLIGLFLLIRLTKVFSSKSHARLFLIYFIPFILIVEDFFYGNRTDSFLLFFSLLGTTLFWSKRLSDLQKLLMLTVMMGICFNLKVHSILYLAPFVGVLAVQNFRYFFISLFVFVFSILLPWIFLRDQLPTYLLILSAISKEMSLWNEGKQVIVLNFWNFIFFIGFWRLKFPSETKLLRAFSLVAIFFATLFASRMGSGTNQIIPLIGCYYTFFRLAEPREFLPKWNWLIVVGLLDLLVSFGLAQRDMYRYFFSGERLFARQAEVRSLIQDLPEQSVFFSYSASEYEDTFLRPEIFFSNKGSLFLVDAVTLMENIHSQIPFPQEARDRLAQCFAPYALMNNKGVPLGLRSYYPPWPVLFDEEWIQSFKAHYKVQQVGQFYTLLKCE